MSLDASFPALVDSTTLYRELTLQPDRLVVLDLRFTPGQAQGHSRYLQGHIPGARYLDLPTQLADAAAPQRGNTPLPRPEALQRDLRALGLNDDSRIVVYDDTTGAPSARALWVLQWAGLRDVRRLDGGWAAWQAAGLPVETGAVGAALAGNVTVRAGARRALEADEVLSFAASGALLDARSADAYAQGRLPGARHLPPSRLLDASGRLLPVEQIRAVLQALQVPADAPVAAYCGGGVAASLVVQALNRAGVDAALYVGSWSEWVQDPLRPIESDAGATA